MPHPILKRTTLEDESFDPLTALDLAGITIPLDTLGSYLMTHAPDTYGDRPSPLCSTSAFPGTSDKIEVMAARYVRGESLYHPEDARWGSEQRIGWTGYTRGERTNAVLTNLWLRDHKGQNPLEE